MQLHSGSNHIWYLCWLADILLFSLILQFFLILNDVGQTSVPPSLKGPQKGRIITIGTSELLQFSPGGKAVEVLLSRANRTSGGRDLSWMKTEPPGGKHLLRPREELGKSPNSDAWWLYHTRLSHSYCLFCSEKKCGTWELWLSCLVTHREKCCNPKRGFYSSLQVLHQSA